MYTNKNNANITTHRRDKSMAGKSAYEIRADLLDLAFRILLTEAQSAAGPDGKYESPTISEVVDKAETLNEFVSTKAN